MGEIYSLGEEEISTLKCRILSLKNEYLSTGIVNLLYLLIIWAYEFIEVMSVNNTDTQATLGRAKRFVEDDGTLMSLFRLRGMLTHRFYDIKESSIIRAIKNNHSDWDSYLLKCGLGDTIFKDILPTLNVSSTKAVDVLSAFEESMK